MKIIIYAIFNNYLECLQFKMLRKRKIMKLATNNLPKNQRKTIKIKAIMNKKTLKNNNP